MTFGFGFGFPRMQGVAAAFSPAVLFAGGEVGTWYDPSDLTTLYQDTAGTSPVTTPGQTVALMLDKSRGLTPGPELVTNGDFSNGSTGYVEVLNGTISYASGAMFATGTTGNTGVYQDIPVISGKSYQISWLIGASTNWRINIYNGAGFGTSLYNNGTGSAASGVFTAVVFPTTTAIRVYAHTGAGNTATFDNISVREIPGNHATQATTLSRPTYAIEPMTGRRNLLTWTEDLTVAPWTTPSGSITISPGVSAPDGTNTATRLTHVSGSGAARFQIFTVNPGTTYTSGVWMRRQSGSGSIELLSINGIGGPSAAVTVTSSWSFVPTPTVISNVASGSSGYFGISFRATGGDVIDFWHPQLELGSTATPYQRVTTQFDVTEAGVASKSYLFFDGSDDFMLTGTITPSTDKAQVFAGVRKLSDAPNGMLVEFSSTFANPGTFALQAPWDNGPAYRFVSWGNGTIGIALPAAPFNAPRTDVLTGIGDISGDRTTLRVNGTQVAQSTVDQGTGNFLAYPLYIGRRGGTTLPFNGNLYGLITRFSAANLDAATITSTETWMNGKTGAYTANSVSPNIYDRFDDLVLDRSGNIIERRA